MTELAPWIDALFAGIFLIGVPALGVIAHRGLQAAIAEGFIQYRRETYLRLIMVQSATSVTLMSYWLWLQRSPEDLGFVIPSFGQAAADVGILATAVVALGWMRRRLRGSEELRTEAWGQLVGFMDLLPHNRRELRLSYLLATVVGYSEELAYRGFLIWWLQQWLPFWGAVVASSLAFGFAHLYQGRQGILKTTAAGFVFAGIYWFSGHLFLAMALHALIDAHAFRVALLLQNRFEWTDRVTDADCAMEADSNTEAATTTDADSTADSDRDDDPHQQ